VPIDLKALLERTATESIRSLDSSVAVNKEIENLPEGCLLDADQIRSAMTSILKFLLMGTDPAKGSVELSASPSDRDGYVNITVRGRHTRSLAQDLHRVFVPLYSRKIIKFGEELGLSSAYGIIRGHGGRIRVSPLKNGCLFQIELPVS